METPVARKTVYIGFDADLDEDSIRVDLIPIFRDLKALSEGGETGSIIAQVYPDGMIVKCLDGSQSAAIQSALGGSKDSDAGTLNERIKQKME